MSMLSLSLQAEVRQTDALTSFHAPDQSLTSLSQKALKHQGPLAPALDSKRMQLMNRTAELRSKARELDACLEVHTHLWTSNPVVQSPQHAMLCMC